MHSFKKAFRINIANNNNAIHSVEKIKNFSINLGFFEKIKSRYLPRSRLFLLKNSPQHWLQLKQILTKNDKMSVVTLTNTIKHVSLKKKFIMFTY